MYISQIDSIAEIAQMEQRHAENVEVTSPNLVLGASGLKLNG